MRLSSSPRKRPASEALVAGGVVVVLLAIVAGVFLSGAGASLYPPNPATAQAQDVKRLYDIVFAIAVAVFIAVEGLIVWSIIRYRRRPGDDELPPQTHGNNLVEIIWTLIPTVIVLYLFAISWQSLNTVDAVSSDPTSPLAPWTPYQSTNAPSMPEYFIKSEWYSITSASVESYGPILG